MIRTIRDIAVAATLGLSFAITLAFAGGLIWAVGVEAADLLVIQPMSGVPTWQAQIAAVGIFISTLWVYWRFFYEFYYEPVPMVPPWMLRLLEDPDEDQEDEQ